MEAIEVAQSGKKFPAFVCGRAGAPAVVVVQEWWGVTDQVQRQAQRIASQGYRCLVPDLYKGKLGLDAEEAGHMMNNLDFPGAVDEIKAAASFLKKEGSAACGVTGFCMGGALSIAAGVKADGDVACVAPFYGIPSKEYFDYSTIKIPVQAHFGQLDPLVGFSDPEAAAALKKALEEAGCEHDVFMYDGVAHGFMNDLPAFIEKKVAMFGAAHSQDAVEMAYDRLFAFFRKHLGA
jgi:carboxymethylenebutenolidase